jgi:hypothetical protein
MPAPQPGNQVSKFNALKGIAGVFGGLETRFLRALQKQESFA